VITEKYIHNQKIRRFILISLIFVCVFFPSIQGDIQSQSLDQLKSFSIISKDIQTKEIGNKVYYNYYTNAFTQAEQELHAELVSPLYFPGVDLNQDWNFIDPFQPLYEQVHITDSTNPPYSFIGHIISSWDTDLDGIVDGYEYCSGFMEGPDIMVTAGHCVFNSKNGGWIVGLVYLPAQNGRQDTFPPAYALNVYLSQDFYFKESADEDWAVVKLDSRIGLETGWFGKGWSPGSLNGKEVAISGYPSEKPYGEVWSAKGEVTASLTTRIKYSMDTAKGESGSPIYDSNGYVWGIHTRGTTILERNSSGTRMTESLYNVIQLEYLYSILARN